MALNASPMGQQALQFWVDAKMQDKETYKFAQDIHHYLGPHADYLMQRVLEVAQATCVQAVLPCAVDALCKLWQFSASRESQLGPC